MPRECKGKLSPTSVWVRSKVKYMEIENTPLFQEIMDQVIMSTYADYENKIRSHSVLGYYLTYNTEKGRVTIRGRGELDWAEIAKTINRSNLYVDCGDWEYSSKRVGFNWWGYIWLSDDGWIEISGSWDKEYEKTVPLILYKRPPLIDEYVPQFQSMEADEFSYTTSKRRNIYVRG